MIGSFPIGDNHWVRTARRRPLRWAAPLLVLGLSACRPALGTLSPPVVSHAGLAVVHGNGSVQTACVAFEEPAIRGDDLLSRSSLGVDLDSGNPMGALVCSIDGEGCRYPSEPCLCGCDAPGSCAYWAYFQRDPDSGWVYSAQGARTRVVRDGDLDGWVWLNSAGPGDAADSARPLQDIHFEDVCPGP